MEKKSSGNHVFYKLMNIVTKNGGKNEKKQIFQNHIDYASKQRLKKIISKKCENKFFINTRISGPKNGGKKTREKTFPVTHLYRVLKTM